MKSFNIDFKDERQLIASSNDDLVKIIDCIYREEDFIVKYSTPRRNDSSPMVTSELIISNAVLSKVKNGEFVLASVEEGKVK